MQNLRDRSITGKRTFNAPVEQLWKGLTEADYIKEWWGPEGFTNTIHKMEVKEGGIWQFTMHGPDGQDYENEYNYRQIKPMKEIVLDHLREPKFTIVISLVAHGNTTELKWQNIFETAPDLEQAINAFKADIGLEQNLNRFLNYVENLPTFII